MILLGNVVSNSGDWALLRMILGSTAAYIVIIAGIWVYWMWREEIRPRRRRRRGK